MDYIVVVDMKAQKKQFMPVKYQQTKKLCDDSYDLCSKHNTKNSWIIIGCIA
jgi:hypothetical protein